MRITDSKRVLWDTCIVIDFIQIMHNRNNISIPNSDTKYFHSILKIWDKYERGDIDIFCSTLAIVEAVHLKGILPPMQVKYILDFFDSIRDSVIAVGIEIAIRANQIRNLSNISLCQYDSIHLGTAQVMNCNIVITRDNKKPRPFLARDNQHKTDNGNRIRILKPEDYIEKCEVELKVEQEEKE